MADAMSEFWYPNKSRKIALDNQIDTLFSQYTSEPDPAKKQQLLADINNLKQDRDALLQQEGLLSSTGKLKTAQDVFKENPNKFMDTSYLNQYKQGLGERSATQEAEINKNKYLGAIKGVTNPASERESMSSKESLARNQQQEYSNIYKQEQIQGQQSASQDTLARMNEVGIRTQFEADKAKLALQTWLQEQADKKEITMLQMNKLISEMNNIPPDMIDQVAGFVGKAGVAALPSLLTGNWVGALASAGGSLLSSFIGGSSEEGNKYSQDFMSGINKNNSVDELTKYTPSSPDELTRYTPTSYTPANKDYMNIPSRSKQTLDQTIENQKKMADDYYRSRGYIKTATGSWMSPEEYKRLQDKASADYTRNEYTGPK